MRDRSKHSSAARSLRLSRLHARDLVTETLSGMLQRPGRSVLTMLGTVLGIGSFVVILGLTATAGSQIDKRFSVLTSTTVRVQDVGVRPDYPSQSIPSSFPEDAGARITALNGSLAAGVSWPVPLRAPVISTTPPGHADASAPQGMSLYAAESGMLKATEPTLSSGVPIDPIHERRREHVALLGTVAAHRLGISRLDAQPAVFVNGLAYTVIGIVSDVRREPQLLNSVIIPAATALAMYGPPTEPRATMLITTKLGAAQLIARQAALAIRPDDPSTLKVIAPPDPRTLRSSVNGDFDTLLLLLASVSLVVGAVGIANTTLVAVLERTGEIGLRRSLGARSRHIIMQFLSESMSLGSLGGLIGTAIGVAVVVAVCLVKGWTVVLQPWAVLIAPLVGAMVGLLAGAYPAFRAGRIEPVEALRR